MHELSIAQSLAEVVAARANERHALRVTLVRLRIGEATAIVPDSLSFCFEMVVSEDPVLAGSRLVIDLVPHRAYCRVCDHEFTVRDFIAECPACGEWSDQIRSGTELQVQDMEIEIPQEVV